MQLKKGDKVLSVNENIKGIVLSILGEVVTISTEDGFDFEFHQSDLIRIDIEQSDLEKTMVLPEHLSQKSDYVKPRKGIKTKNKNIHEPLMEVDLHIEKLVKSTKGMDNYDILSIQLDTTKHKLEFAIRNKIPKIIFIHGVGEGVLKEEIRYLCQRYSVSITDASYQKYGMGATEVYIHQNPKDRL